MTRNQTLQSCPPSRFSPMCKSCSSHLKRAYHFFSTALCVAVRGPASGKQVSCKYETNSHRGPVDTTVWSLSIDGSVYPVWKTDDQSRNMSWSGSVEEYRLTWCAGVRLLWLTDSGLLQGVRQTIVVRCGLEPVYT